MHTTTLDVPGARLYCELRGAGPLLLLVGAPMDARAFEGLAEALAGDFTVLTTDPRGINRSTVADRGAECTPRVRADDLARIVRSVPHTGPAVVFGTSGGAVSVLELAQRHPELLELVVAHEPPLDEMLPDRRELYAATEDMIAVYAAGDHLAAMRKFLQIANIELPEPVFAQYFGGPRSAQQVADDDYQFFAMLRSSVRWLPDLDALRRTRVLVGIGEQSTDQLCDRAARALAEQLGVWPTMFPGDHTGFLDDPAGFAARLRAVIDPVTSVP